VSSEYLCITGFANGYWILDAGCWLLDADCWILDAGHLLFTTYNSLLTMALFRE